MADAADGDRTNRPGAGRLSAALEWRSLLELFVVSGFVVAQPLFDVMGRSPDWFVFRRADRRDILALAVVVLLAAPLVLWVVETLAGLALGARVRRVVHLVALTGLFGLLGIELAKTVAGVHGVPAVAVGVATAAGLLVLYLRQDAIRLWLTYLTPAPLVFAALFLAVSPVSDLVLPQGGPSASASTAGSETPVVAMVLDEFPLTSLLDGDGKVDRRLFPNFARLADQSTWFRNTAGVAGFTPFALPMMLSGNEANGNAPVVTQYPDNLFTWLGGSHEVKAFESITALCPADLCDEQPVTGPTGARAVLRESATVLGSILSPSESREDIEASLVEETDRERKEREGAIRSDAPQPKSQDDTRFAWDRLQDNQPARFTQFVDSFDGDAPPTLWFLHLLMPHNPWRYLPDGTQYPQFNFGKSGKGSNIDEEWPLTVRRQRHLLQLAYTDRLLGEVIDKLEAEGLWDRALVTLIADHGMGFEPEGYTRQLRSSDDPTIASLVFVPFFMKLPGQDKGEVVDTSVSAIDVVPTLADALDIELPWDVVGRSAFADRPESATYRFAGKPSFPVDTGTWFPKALEGMAPEVARPDLGVEGLYRVGPWAEHVGAPLDRFRVVDSTARATVTFPKDPATVKPESGALPALIGGRMEDAGDVEDPRGVAVALNGRVALWSDLFDDADLTDRFVGMIDPALFEAGENRIELFVVTGDPASPVLHRVDAPS